MQTIRRNRASKADGGSPAGGSPDLYGVRRIQLRSHAAEGPRTPALEAAA